MIISYLSVIWYVCHFVFSLFVMTPLTLLSTLPWTFWWRMESVKEWLLSAWRTDLFTVSEPRTQSLLPGMLLTGYLQRRFILFSSVFVATVFSIPPEAMEEPISAAHLPTLAPEMETPWWLELACPVRIWSLSSSTLQVREECCIRKINPFINFWLQLTCSCSFHAVFSLTHKSF